MCVYSSRASTRRKADRRSIRSSLLGVVLYIYKGSDAALCTTPCVCVCVLADPILFFFCIQGLLLLFRRKQQKASAGEEGEAKNKFVPSFTHPRQKEEEEEKENGLSEFIKIESS